MNFFYKVMCLFCFCATSCQSIMQQDAEYVILADQQMFAFAREVKATDQLKLVSYGGGFLNCVNKLSLDFASPVHPNIDQARFIFFDIAFRFLDQVNQNEALRPYLVTYPFTMENLDLLIIFPHEKNGSIVAVGMEESFPNRKRSYLFFDAYDFLKQDFAIIHKELYEDAVNLYEQQRTNPSENL